MSACVRTYMPVGEAWLGRNTVNEVENYCSLGSDGWLRTSACTEAAVYHASDLTAMAPGTCWHRGDGEGQERLKAGQKSKHIKT